jgi:CDP-6-deoxy-D-xylo-4-hexulose-3-dehydrase
MGEGGAVYTSSRRLAKIARSVRDWGRDCYCGYDNPVNGKCGIRFEREVPGVPGFYDHRYYYTEIGYNLKITDPQAAMGLAQMDKLPRFIAQRKANFAYLYAGMKQFEEFLLLPTWQEKADPSWFAFPILIKKNASFQRHELTRYLEMNKVETRNIFAGNITKQPAYRGMECRVVGDLAVSDLVMQRAFFVGVYPGLDNQRLDYIIDTFARFFQSI